MRDPSTKGTKQLTFIDKIIERGIIFLLIFTPLAFGTVQQWSVAVMEIVAFSIFSLYVIKRILEMPAQCHSREGSIPGHEDSESQGRSPGARSSWKSHFFSDSAPRGLTTALQLPVDVALGVSQATCGTAGT